MIPIPLPGNAKPVARITPCPPVRIAIEKQHFFGLVLQPRPRREDWPKKCVDYNTEPPCVSTVVATQGGSSIDSPGRPGSLPFVTSVLAAASQQRGRTLIPVPSEMLSAGPPTGGTVPRLYACYPAGGAVRACTCTCSAPGSQARGWPRACAKVLHLSGFMPVLVTAGWTCKSDRRCRPFAPAAARYSVAGPSSVLS